MSFHAQLLEADRRRAAWRCSPRPSSRAACAARSRCPATSRFLREAYHHVRHTVPLLRACKAALPARRAWLARAAGRVHRGGAGPRRVDPRRHPRLRRRCARPCATAAPGHATEVMVAYAYDTIARRNPLGFFGMVHVLEGTSVSLALLAADQIQKPLGLPDAAFSYLRSHGTLDQEHVAHFAAADGPDRRRAATRPTSFTRRARSSACTATCSAACRCRRRPSGRSTGVAA